MKLQVLAYCFLPTTLLQANTVTPGSNATGWVSTHASHVLRHDEVCLASDM